MDRLVDFKAIVSQKPALVEELGQAKYIDVVSDLPLFRLIEVGSHTQNS